MLPLRDLAYGIHARTAGLGRPHVGGNKPLCATLQTQAVGKAHARLPTVEHHNQIVGLAIDRARLGVHRISPQASTGWRQLANELMLRAHGADIQIEGKSCVWEKGVYIRVNLGGRGTLQKKKYKVEKE